MKKQHRIFIVICLALIGCIIGLAKYSLHNENYLAHLAEEFDIPSKPYYFFTERIFQLAENRNIGKTFEDHLEANRNQHLHNSYIYYLGIIGQSQSTVHIMNQFIQFQNEPSRKSTIYRIINHMGNSGNYFYSNILEVLLRNYKNHKPLVSQYQIARSLFLIMGNNQEYIDENGKKHELIITDELKTAHNAIASSRGRRRTFEEMLLIDNVTRSPTWIYVAENK